MTEMSQAPTTSSPHVVASVSTATFISPIADFFYGLAGRIKEYTREAVEHLILTVLIYCVLCVLLYVGIVRWRILEFRRDVRNPKRVLLVIAHPDDECMFFGPTVLNFTGNRDCTLYVMCLSTGNNYGMGKTRKRELYESCKTLGVDEGCILVHTHTLLPDCMQTRWPVDLVSQMILQQVESYGIDTLITFDKHGISRHQNHCSIYYAIAHLMLEKKLPTGCRVYVLETINILRKYWLLLDIPISFIFSRNRYILQWDSRALIYEAMKQHQSQLLWFRRLYMLFSRYTLINTLQEMDLVDLELELEIDD